MLFYGAILLTILSYTIYHTAQKFLSGLLNPFYIVAVAYTISALIAWGLFFVMPVSGRSWAFEWPILAMAVAVVGLDVGFLLAYRAGWAIGVAPIFANVAVALILIPVGFWLFRERLSWVTIMGVMFCISGLLLLRAK